MHVTAHNMLLIEFFASQPTGPFPISRTKKQRALFSLHSRKNSLATRFTAEALWHTVIQKPRLTFNFVPLIWGRSASTFAAPEMH